MAARLGFRLLGVLLICDSIGGGIGAARALHLALSGDPSSIVVVIGRVIAGGAGLAAGWGAVTGRPRARDLAALALVASAVMTSLEIGGGLAPGAAFMAGRWVVVAAAWIYAAAWIVFVRAAGLYGASASGEHVNTILPMT